MHPAPSIIVFTTLSGLGYGLAAMLGLGLLDPALVATKAAYLLALALICGGLLSSTLHLGNPQRAWRALSQWRSSWLSREGVMALLTFAPLMATTAAALLQSRALPLVGLAACAMAAITVFSTAMIYASLRAIDAWATPLTPLSYLLFAAAGGSLLAAAFAAAGGQPIAFAAMLALAFLLAAWTVKCLWWRRLDSLTPRATPESATGLGGIGKVRLFEAPHMTENYLTREMGFRVARKHARKLRRLALVFGGIGPSLLIVLALAAGAHGAMAIALTAGAAALHVPGILAERWLFFAEARHAVMNYYGNAN